MYIRHDLSWQLLGNHCFSWLPIKPLFTAQNDHMEFFFKAFNILCEETSMNHSFIPALPLERNAAKKISHRLSFVFRFAYGIDIVYAKLFA